MNNSKLTGGYSLWPKTMHIDITDRCNFRCKFCAAHQHDSPGDQMRLHPEMTDKVFKKCLPFVKHAEKIIIAGGGEPTYAQNILGKLETLKIANPKVNIRVITNASRFSDYKFLKKFSMLVDEIHVSMNGLTNRDLIMRESSLENFKLSLRNLSIIKKIFAGPHLSAGYIIMRSNIKDIVKTATLLKYLGFDTLNFKELWVTTSGLKKQSIRHDENLKRRAAEELLKAKKIDIRQNIFPYDFTRNYIKGKESSSINGSTEQTRTEQKKKSSSCNRFKKSIDIACSSPWDEIKITSYGEVRICCFGRTAIGRLNGDDTLYNIWNGDEIKRYREGMLTKKYHNACSRCHCVTDSNVAFERSELDDFLRKSGLERRKAKLKHGKSLKYSA